MKKLRVFQTVKIKRRHASRAGLLIKRTVPGFSFGNLGTFFLFLILTPYLITFFFGNLREGTGEKVSFAKEETGSVFVNNETSFGREKIPLEDYVADKLARSMDSDFEMEALKAQAVLIRSNLLAEREEENGREISVADSEYGKNAITEKILEATVQTKGVYLTFAGRIVEGAYFAISNGRTRNGKEALSDEYSYLQSVSCERDFLADDFGSSFIFSEKEFEINWESMFFEQLTEDEILDRGQIAAEKEMEKYTLYRDSADYVLYIEESGAYAGGEEFRKAFGLPSADFHLEKEDGEVIISVKGAGHGFGMSQFGANEMAKEGNDYVRILDYFFQDATITKFE